MKGAVHRQMSTSAGQQDTILMILLSIAIADNLRTVWRKRCQAAAEACRHLGSQTVRRNPVERGVSARRGALLGATTTESTIQPQRQAHTRDIIAYVGVPPGEYQAARRSLPQQHKFAPGLESPWAL
jgi:hypothetical protein